MTDMIRKFYEGEDAAADKIAEPRDEVHRLTGLVADAEEKLRGTLTAEQAAMLLEFEDYDTELQDISQYDRYRRGFLDGARLMLNIFLPEHLVGECSSDENGEDGSAPD